MRRIEGATELLDGPLDDALLEGNLRDLERANRWLGGSSLSWRALGHVLAETPPQTALSLLDVGTGGADIPRALVARSKRASRAVIVRAVDIRKEIVALARRRSAHMPEIEVELVGEGHLELADDSFDVVHASLVLHHLDPPSAARLLAEMARVARRAVIVNDLVRARRWWLAALLLSRLATGNRYTRHDAPLSVQRAYLPVEVAGMAATVGLRPWLQLHGRLGHRYAIVLRHDESVTRRP